VIKPQLPGRSFFHGTKVDLKPGDLIKPGYNSNYGKRKQAAYIYLSGTLNAAIWAAELALGESPAESTWWRRLALLKTTPI
jgi:rifampin ADP-ribosylating transferase